MKNQTEIINGILSFEVRPRQTRSNLESIIFVVSAIFVVLAAFGAAPNAALADTFGKPLSKPRSNLGLVGYWTFDGKDMPNGRASDISGNSYHGYLVSMSTSSDRVSGKLGQALNFDGVNDIVDTGKALSNFTDGSNGTYAVWVYPTSPGTGACSNLGASAVITDGTAIGGYTEIGITGGSWCAGWWGTPGTAGLTSPAKLNTWSHVALTVKNGTEFLYVNGVQVGTQAVGATTVLTFPIQFGQSFDGNFFKGKVDDARIYSRALSAAEIKALYQMGGTKLAKTPVTRLSNGLVGYWTFDGKDMPAGLAKDVTGLGNDGHLVSMSTSTAYVAGKLGQALNFNGSTRYVTAPPSSSLTLTGNMSMGGWIYFNSLPLNNGDYVGFIFKMSTGAVDVRNGFGIQPSNTSGVVKFSVNWGIDSFYDNITCNQVISRQIWYHVFITRSGTTAYCYINGVLDKQGTVLSAFNNSETNLDLGRNWSNNTHILNGKLDDVRIYSRALSTTEIEALYQMGGSKLAKTPVNRLSQGLVGYWTFDGKDMPAGLAKDVTGLGNDGHLVSMSSSTAYTAGKLGQALNFDGVNDFVNAGSGSSLNPSAVSVLAWVKANNLSKVYNTVVDKQQIGSAYYQIAIKSNGKFSGYVFASASVNCDGSGSKVMTLGNWYHLALTYDSLSGLKCYVNSVLDSSVVANGSLANNTAVMTIGTTIVNAGRSFSGNIDDVRVYNRALSAAEVKALYLIGK